MNNTGIACAGHIIVDLVKLIDSWPREGMLVSIEAEQQHGGGLVYNCLTDLSRMDSDLPLYALGIVGEDQYGEYVINRLASSGVDCSYITTTASAPTSYTNVMSVINGQRTFFHLEGANTELDVPHLVDNDLSPKIFHLGYLALLQTLDLPDAEYGTRAAKVLNTMQKRGCRTSVDLVSVAHPDFNEIVKASLPYTDYLIINEVEAEMATGLSTRENNVLNEGNVRRAAVALLNGGVGELVIVHSPEGGFGISRSGQQIFVPSYPMQDSEIKGTVGAGDAFCSGVLYGLHQEYSLEECLHFANAAARFSLMHETSTAGIPTARVLQNFIQGGVG